MFRIDALNLIVGYDAVRGKDMRDKPYRIPRDGLDHSSTRLRQPHIELGRELWNYINTLQHVISERRQTPHHAYAAASRHKRLQLSFIMSTAKATGRTS